MSTQSDPTTAFVEVALRYVDAGGSGWTKLEAAADAYRAARASQPATVPALTEEQVHGINDSLTRLFQRSETHADLLREFRTRIEALEASSLRATEAKPGTAAEDEEWIERSATARVGIVWGRYNNSTFNVAVRDELRGVVRDAMRAAFDRGSAAAPPPSPDRGTAVQPIERDTYDPPSPAPEAAPTAEEWSAESAWMNLMMTTYEEGEAQRLSKKAVLSELRAAESRGAARAREETEELRSACAKWAEEATACVRSSFDRDSDLLSAIDADASRSPAKPGGAK
jgi:hypothetical protein